MDKTNSRYFDLPGLLRMKDMDVRSFAKAKPSLSVNEYYGILSEFIDLAPDVLRALGQFERRDGDKDAARSLDDMIDTLEKMGCKKFIVEFHSILDAYMGSGNWRLAGTHAAGIKEDFNDFYWRIVGLKKKNKSGVDEPGQHGAAYSDELTMVEAIRQIDEENADSKPLILAIDDSPVILQSVWTILSDGYKVLTLTNPLDIDKVLQRQTPVLFLLDYQMPEMNGFELIPVIRGYDAHKETPIIFLTSEGTFDNVTAALALGGRDYIVKPFKAETLREKIGKYINGRQVSDGAKQK
jgi:twitching motility two-component system response regulator PilG